MLILSFFALATELYRVPFSSSILTMIEVAGALGSYAQPQKLEQLPSRYPTGGGGGGAAQVSVRGPSNNSATVLVPLVSTPYTLSVWGLLSLKVRGTGIEKP